MSLPPSDPWTASQQPYNQREDPLDVLGRLPRWNPPPSDPFQPVPNPLHATPMPTGPGMPLGDALSFLGRSAAGDFGLNLAFVGFLWGVWVCLYPAAALAGLFTLLYAMPFLRSVLPPSPIIGPGLYAVVLGFVAAAVVLWNVSRFEHILARTGFYRIARHLVRLPLLGLATVVAIEEAHGMRYNLTLPAIERVLKSPQNLGIVLAAMVASHFILWNWKWGREFWHRRLMGAQLRKRGT